MCLIKSSTYVAEQSRKLIIRGFILGFITDFATHELLTSLTQVWALLRNRQTSILTPISKNPSNECR